MEVSTHQEELLLPSPSAVKEELQTEAPLKQLKELSSVHDSNLSHKRSVKFLADFLCCLWNDKKETFKVIPLITIVM